MNKIPLPLTALVQENMSVVAQFAFSRKPLEALARERFEGEWDSLRKVIFEIAEQRALRAFIELAVYLRALDDEENLSGILTKTIDMEFGRVIKKNNQPRPLRLRDVSNKVIHASSFRWELSNPDQPVFVCESKDKAEDWIRAEIEIVAMLTVGSLLVA